MMTQMDEKMIGQEDDDEILDEVSINEDQANDETDEEDYALVTEPKLLNPDVVKGGGAKLQDEILSNIIGITNLDEKRKLFDIDYSNNHLANGISSSGTVEPSETIQNSNNECQMIRHGQVKDRLSKFEDQANNTSSNGNNAGEASPYFSHEDEEDFKNANISGRSNYKKREELKLDVDSKSIKSKFENNALGSTGNDPANKDQSINNSTVMNNCSPLLELELNALKSAGVTQVKEKFKQQRAAAHDDSVSETMAKKKSNVMDEILTPVATASIHEAKEKFMKGEAAFHPESTFSSEKFREPIPFSELSSVKERFEQQNVDSGTTGSPGKSAVQTLQQISPVIPAGSRCAELNSLKASFEAGGKKKFSEDELEARRKKHLEMEFKRLQIEKSIFNEKQRREAEEEAKNQKLPSYQDVESIEKCKELNALKQKFEQVGAEDSTNANAATPEELSAIIDKEEAKQIKAKFESNAFEKDNQACVDPEEKLKHIRAEFEQFKEIKQQMEPSVNEEGAEIDQQNKDEPLDLKLAAEHTQKVRAKWDKIQRKEAKKAQKAAGIKEKISSPSKCAPIICEVCGNKVYLAEAIECDCKLFHKSCFKCKQCGCALRLETCHTTPDGLYCKVHYKLISPRNTNLRSASKISRQPVVATENSQEMTYKDENAVEQQNFAENEQLLLREPEILDYKPEEISNSSENALEIQQLVYSTDEINNVQS